MKKTEANKLKELQTKIGVKFKNNALLTEALTHRSFQNENKNEQAKHNERLEFLGDAVLELVVTEYLFTKHTEFAEGELTSLRSALVKTTSLSEESKRLGIGQYMFMSYGEESSGGRDREYILANVFEAIIGAIYIDKGYETSKKFIIKNLCYKSQQIIKQKLYIDAKSQLQSTAQEIFRITPTYELVSSEGPDHDKIFTMALVIGDHKLTSGSGKSKQEAEQAAAEKALLKWDEIVKLVSAV